MASYDDSNEKLRFLNEILSNTDKFIKICDTDGFKDEYPFKEEEWNHRFQNITTELNDQIVLLFIGPFSSGKSTFVNALIGKDILPTNDSPCTAVITEIQFKKGGDHSAKIFRKGQEEDPEECDFSKVIDIINGPTGAVGDTASYHHIVLELDTEQLENKCYEQFVGKVKIVDCPGYGSKYYSNEDVINDYIQSSNFTFWMSPYDKFGGTVAKDYLSVIKRKTQTLIPVITKSDKVKDENKREKIRESFQKELGDFFKVRSISFVSAVKWQEGRRLQKSLEKNREKLSEKEIEDYQSKIKKLIDDSGINNVMGQMMNSVDKKNINEAKIALGKTALLDLLKEIKKVADDELRRWDKALKETGVDIKSIDNKYSRIDGVKKDIDKWIKDNVKEFSDTLNIKIVSELSKCDKPTKNEISERINNVLKEEQPKINAKLKDKLQKSYKQFLGEFRISADDIEQLDFGGMSFDDIVILFEPIKNVLFAIFEALKSSGGPTVITGATGSGLLVSIPAISKLSVLGIGIGSGLATVASIAGVALLGIAIVTMIPDFAEKVKKFRNRSKEERENELRNLLAIGFKEKIQPGLEKSMLGVSEKYYDSIISQIDNTNGNKEQNYKTVASVIDNVTQNIDSINKNF